MMAGGCVIALAGAMYPLSNPLLLQHWWLTVSAHRCRSVSEGLKVLQPCFLCPIVPCPQAPSLRSGLASSRSSQWLVSYVALPDGFGHSRRRLRYSWHLAVDPRLRAGEIRATPGERARLSSFESCLILVAIGGLRMGDAPIAVGLETAVGPLRSGEAYEPGA